MTRSRVLLKRLNDLLDGLDYDFAAFDIESFTECVARMRGRPIRSERMRLPPGMFGAWLKGPSADYIFYEDTPQVVHAIHIRLHELAHVLLGHPTLEITEERLGTLPVQDLAAAAQRSLSGLGRDVRCVPSPEAEVEAETLSNLIHTRVFRLAGLRALIHAEEHRDPQWKELLSDMHLD